MDEYLDLYNLNLIIKNGKREVQKETRNAVCESISKVLGINIPDKSRKRELINGRMIYYALLRDMNYSWTSIARRRGQEPRQHH